MVVEQCGRKDVGAGTVAAVSSSAVKENSMRSSALAEKFSVNIIRPEITCLSFSSGRARDEMSGRMGSVAERLRTEWRLLLIRNMLIIIS